ncbi:MAG: hypothetical protein M3R04_00430 [bacterium]|nr:hypothetical protein [bacterium]
MSKLLQQDLSETNGWHLLIRWANRAAFFGLFLNFLAWYMLVSKHDEALTTVIMRPAETGLWAYVYWIGALLFAATAVFFGLGWLLTGRYELAETNGCPRPRETGSK